MRIITHEDRDTASEFRRLKRRKWDGWRILIEGRWTQFPIHDGKLELLWRCSADYKMVSIMQTGWDKRILAIATDCGDLPVDEVLGRLLGFLRKQGLPFIDHKFLSFGDELDEDIIMEYYSGRKPYTGNVSESEDR